MCRLRSLACLSDFSECIISPGGSARGGRSRLALRSPWRGAPRFGACGGHGFATPEFGEPLLIDRGLLLADYKRPFSGLRVVAIGELRGVCLDLVAHLQLT